MGMGEVAPICTTILMRIANLDDIDIQPDEDVTQLSWRNPCKKTIIYLSANKTRKVSGHRNKEEVFCKKELQLLELL